MKKLIYLILALVIIAGIAFLLGNTKLFKGATQIEYLDFTKEPLISAGGECLAVDIFPDTVELTKEELDSGDPIDVSVRVEISNLYTIEDPLAPTKGELITVKETIKEPSITLDVWLGTLRVETTNAGGIFATTDDPTTFASPLDIAIDNRADEFFYTYNNPQFGDVITASVLKSGNLDCTDSFTITELAVVAVPDPVNLPPLPLDDNTTVDQRFAAIIDVLANDIDPDGTINPTTVEIIDQPINGFVSVNATTGVVTYSPDAESGFVGLDTFTYQMSDDQGLLSDGYGLVSVTVTAAPVEDTTPPVEPTPDPTPTPTPDVDAPDLADLLDSECTDDYKDTRYADGSGKWYTDFVCVETVLDIFQGREAGFFVPNSNITIAEFLKAFLLTAKVDVNVVADASDITFPDVKEGKWYTDYMVASAALGVYTKPEGAPARPNDDITRREAFIIIADLFGLTEEDYEISEYCTDVTEFDEGADAVATLMQIVVDVPGEGEGRGLTTVVTGNADGTCDLDGNMERSEAAALVIRALLSIDLDTLFLDEEALLSL